MRRDLSMAVLLCVVFSACAHLLQKETWTSRPRTLELQQNEYLFKELVRGLPEDVFRRWYDPQSAARDPLRPAITTRAEEDGFTVYELASSAGVAGRVAFRDAALDHWTRMQLMQEAVVSSWMEQTITPPTVSDEALARIAALDPAADPLRPDARPDPRDVCPLEAGTMVDTMRPMLYDRDHGNRLIRNLPPSRLEDRGASESVLPAGTALSIRAWNVVHGRRLADAAGTTYRIDDPMGLRSYAGVVCPAGACAQPGGFGIVSRDLPVWSSGEPGDAALAVLPGASRVPVWMERIGILRAGDRVRIRKWNACGSMIAEIDPPEGGGLGITTPVQVPVAPPGLFRPVAAAPAGGAGP